MKKLIKWEKAWVAALIDGEGSIYITKTNDPKCKRGYLLGARISISNTNTDLLEKFEKVLGISDKIHFAKDKRKIGKNGFRVKDRYILLLNPSYVRELLPQISPFLVAKQKQATTMMKFLKAFDRKPLFRGEYPEEILRLYRNLKELNQKGQKIEGE